MKTAHILFTAVLSVFVLTGCGTKRQYFQPETLSGKVNYDGTLPATLIDSTREGATLENGQIITKEKGLMSTTLPKDVLFLTENKGRYVGAATCGNLIIVDEAQKTIFQEKFNGVVASAALKDDLLALVLGSNELVLINIATGKHLASVKQDNVSVLDSRMASPYFLGDLVVFPTLDGKLVIVDERSGSVVREIVVSSEKFFGNIIYLQILGDRLVAATKSKAVSITPSSIVFYDADIKDMIVLENRIFIFTKDGRVILTDADLKVLKERKFPFATFAGTIYGNFVYMIEKSGYVIATDLDLISTNVYKLPDEIDEHLFTTKDALYYGNHFFKLNRK